MDPNRKRVICILTTVMILLLAIPSFASGGSGSGSRQTADGIEQTDQTEDTEKTEGVDQQEGDGPVVEEDRQTTGTEEQTEQAEQEEQTETAAEEEKREEPAEEADEEKPEETEKMKAASNASSGLPENDTKVEYTSAGSHPVKFTVKTDKYTFKGTCATLGANNSKSGKATVKRISNNSRIAKLVYYYGYKKGWWQGKNSGKKATSVMEFSDSKCTENAKQCIEALIQRDNMGWSDFWAARKIGKYRMYSTDSFMKEINDLYKNTDVSKITIPDDVVFEMFHGTTSSSKTQDFYAWRYKEIPVTVNGFVAVEKVSGDVAITE